MKSCEIFIKEIEANSSRQRVDCWTVPASLFPVQMFPVHIMHFAGNVYKHAALYKTR